MENNQQHVLITGGSSGIGLEIARLAASNGYKVSILGRDIDRLKKAHQQLKIENGVDISIFSADVADPGKVQESVDQAVARNGTISYLVCSAGYSKPGVLADTDIKEFQKHMDVNLIGSVNCVKSCIGQMREQKKGRIILIGYILSMMGIYGYSAYSASKFALKGFAECLNHESISDNIYVGICYPPDTDTPMYHNENKYKPEITKRLSETAGLSQPLDVAKACFKNFNTKKFHITVGTDGWVISMLTTGMSPVRSTVSRIGEIFMAPILKIIAWYYSSSFEKMILNNDRKT